jgi:hypothetical protein
MKGKEKESKKEDKKPKREKRIDRQGLFSTYLHVHSRTRFIDLRPFRRG